MTLDEAFEYVDRAHESEGEQRAEHGMGAVSMGFDPYDAMACYGGYRTADDPQYAEAMRIIGEHNDKNGAELQRESMNRALSTPDPDDIPF